MSHDASDALDTSRTTLVTRYVKFCSHLDMLIHVSDNIGMSSMCSNMTQLFREKIAVGRRTELTEIVTSFHGEHGFGFHIFPYGIRLS